MSKTYHPDIVPALDMLIGDPDNLRPDAKQPRKADILHIPKNYIYRLHAFCHEQTNRGEACGELAGLFSKISEHIHIHETPYVCENGTQVVFEEVDPKFLPPESTINSTKGQAIAVASKLKEEGKNVAIMTGDDFTSTFAYLSGIDIAHINPDVYIGRRQVVLPDHLSNMWFGEYDAARRKIPGKYLHEIQGMSQPKANEFIEFYSDQPSDPTFSNIGRYDAETESIVGLKYLNQSRTYGIWPRNPGQAMMFEALMTPAEEAPIVIISGIYGTGKTFLTTACGIIQSEAGDYDGIFVCPRDGALGKEIGFLPGDANTKIRAKAKPIEDNVREFSKIRGIINKKDKDYHDTSKNSIVAKRNCLDRRVEETLENYFEYEALITMGGRSIANRYIIYDEFQDMERYQAKALLTRVGDSSKMVILGDPEQQTNPHMNKTSNGLSYSASKLGGVRGVYVVTLNKEEIVRSQILCDIAARLEHR